MSGEIVKQTLVKNWYLFVVLAAFLLTALYRVSAPGDDSAVNEVSLAGAETARIQRSAPAAAPRDLVTENRAKTREEAMAKIRENEAALAVHPEPEIAAAYVNGIGNMYFQRLQDYSAAATHYERVLSDYPDAPMKYQTFVQLVQCYEKLNDQDKRRDTLRRMMDAYPADSQQYTYAHLELYGEMPAAAIPSTSENNEDEIADAIAVAATTEVIEDNSSSQ